MVQEGVSPLETMERTSSSGRGRDVTVETVDMNQVQGLGVVTLETIGYGRTDFFKKI